jgi:hypothetical protein
MDIDAWLRLNLTTKSINSNLIGLDSEAKEIAPGVLSRHRTQCLGLGKLMRGRRGKVQQTKKDLEDAEDPSDAEVMRIAKKAFYSRLKNNPQSVKTSEIVSMLSAMGRLSAGTAGKKSPLEEAMADLWDEDVESAANG